MSSLYKSSRFRTPCTQCPLSKLSHFRPHSARETSFLDGFKTGELAVDPRSTIFEQNAHSAHLYSVLSGWAFRYKTLEDGRRQILNYVLPGDLIGLQGALMKEMQHSVEALTPMSLCVFQRDRMKELFTDHPGLAYDVTWLAACEEQLLDEHLLSVGRRTALERSAYLLAFLGRRALNSGMATPDEILLPLNQQHIADTLGLSLVHTNKTLRKLADRKLVRWRDRICEVLDIEGLIGMANWETPEKANRPFI